MYEGTVEKKDLGELPRNHQCGKCLFCRTCTGGAAAGYQRGVVARVELPPDTYVTECCGGVGAEGGA